MNRHQRRAWKRKVKGMHLKIEIDFKYRREVEEEGGKKVKKRVRETRTYERDLEDLPLVILEMGETDSIRESRQAVADFLDLSDEEARQITLGHIRQITDAVKAAQTSPNGISGG